ncbi:MAG: 3-deoxy-manno-octulosonate cytidylyltransferase [Rikenellaceae bacterium]
MINFIAIIPARYASTRFPGKPLVDIFGKTMIQRVYEKAKKSFNYVVVATDDCRIAENVESFGGVAVMTSTHHKSGTDRCQEAATKAKQLFATHFDVIINIQGDEPFVDNSQLEAIKGCFDDTDCQIATLVKSFSQQEDIFNENSPKVVLSNSSYAIYFSRSPIPFIRGKQRDEWSKSHTFYKHIGLYGYRSEVLRAITTLPQGQLEISESLEQLRWLENGYKIKTAITHSISHAIDTPDDLEKVLSIYKESHIDV